MFDPTRASYSNGVVNITPLLAPIITTQPTNQSAIPGQNVSFVTAASGSTPLRFQWQFNGTPLPNATNATLALTNVTTNDAGPYRAIVSNDGGSATSQVATITVNLPPVITAQPQGRAVSAGESVVFAVSATGTGPLAYQWRRNGANLAGRTNDSLVLTNVTTTDAGSYSVVISGPGGSVTSANAALTVSATARFLRLVNRTSITGADVDVPVELTGFGDENAVGFSVQFDPAQITWRSATLGAGAAGGTLNVNEQSAAAGRVGLAVTRLAGQTFSAGVSSVATLRFRSDPIAYA